MSGIVLLFGLGLLLIVAEVLIPSFGMLGAAATLCILGSIGWAYTEDPALGEGRDESGSDGDTERQEEDSFPA